MKLLVTGGFTSAALGGTLALPFTGVLLSAIELAADALSDDDEEPLDLEKMIYEGFLDITGDQKLATALAYGLGNMAGFDLHSRTSFARPLWSDQFTSGQGAEGAMDNFWGNVTGPAPNMANNFVQSLYSMAEGDYQLALKQTSPKFLKDFIKVLEDSEDDVRYTRYGNYVSEVTTWDKFVQGFGFTPDRISQAYNQRGYEFDKKKYLTERKKKLLLEHNEAMDDKDYGRAREIRRAMRSFSNRYRDYKISRKSVDDSYKSYKDRRQKPKEDGDE